MPETVIPHFQTELDAYLTTHSVAKLQIGAGHHLLPGWFNTDINKALHGVCWLDSSQPFPIADYSGLHQALHDKRENTSAAGVH